MTGKIRVLKIQGSYYDMGYQHGTAYADDIRAYTHDRVHLAGDKNWAGIELAREQVLQIAESCVQAHWDYCPDLMEELRGMADATGLSLAELIIMNGFTDFIDVVYSVGKNLAPSAPQVAVPNPVDDCTAVVIPNSATADGHGFYAQTWDMHDTATPFVILLEGKPTDAPSFLNFTTMGCLGQIGMNSAGIALGINNIMAKDGQVGVMWPFVVRKALQQTDIESALACITDAPLAGAHNYQLFDKHGNGYNVEAMPSRVHVEKLDQDALIHTNHCLISHNREVERERTPDSMASSVKRLASAQAHLSQRPITQEALVAMTQDESAICVRPKPPMNVETCGAAIMRPASGDFWAVWGLPSENVYEHFTI